MVAFIAGLLARAGAEELPEQLLFKAKENAVAQIWKVDERIPEKELQISGLVGGADFDLTMRRAGGGEMRQIVIGARAWSSGDGGKTWRERQAPDRTPFYLVHAPISFDPEEKIPRFETIGGKQSGLQNTLHVQLHAPEAPPDEAGRPNYWLLTQPDQPPRITRYLGPVRFEEEIALADVSYLPLEKENGLLPPPGNPQAARAVDFAGDLLDKALAQTAAEPALEIRATLLFKKTAHLHGLLAGRDFDLTTETDGGAEPFRQIAIGEAGWTTHDRALTWSKTEPVERAVYEWLRAPISPGQIRPMFEDLGSEMHGAENWVHLRSKNAGGAETSPSRQHYWIAVDPAGNSLGVRRFEGPLLLRNKVTHVGADYTVPPGPAKILPPPNE